MYRDYKVYYRYYSTDNRDIITITGGSASHLRIPANRGPTTFLSRSQYSALSEMRTILNGIDFGMEYGCRDEKGFIHMNNMKNSVKEVCKFDRCI